jgi:hypothetical protein
MDSSGGRVPDLERGFDQQSNGGERDVGEFDRAAFDATEPDAALRAAWQAPEFSRTTIAADPWTAVYLPVPERPNPWLLLKAHDAARECEAMIDRDPRSGPELPLRDNGPDENRLRAAERAGDLSERLQASLEEGRLPWPTIPDERDRSAWQAPEFSRKTMEADPWTAVYLPIPEHADPQLLAYARSWVSDLRQAAEIGVRSNSVYFGPVMDNMYYSREEKMSAATERLSELDERLEIARGYEARLAGIIGETSLRAVNDPIPRGAHGETLNELRNSVRQTMEQLGDIWDDSGIPGAYVDRKWAAAKDRLDEVHVQLEVTQVIELGPAIQPSRERGEFLSGWFIASRIADRVLHAAEMVVDTVLGFLVPEPTLTPQQARDLARADAERAESRAFEMVHRENATALYEINAHIDREQMSVRGVVRDPEAIYERYPGLTREAAGDEQQREIERAFYDTGIERGR